MALRLKLDENLPASLVGELADLGHDPDTVAEEGLQGRDDPDVWRATQDTGRFLITQDLDFSDLRAFEPGTHHGLLLVRLREPSRRALIERVCALFRTEDVASWPGCFVVATDHKVESDGPGISPRRRRCAAGGGWR